MIEIPRFPKVFPQHFGVSGDATTPWYQAGGASPLAVYVPKGAPSLAASYVNIVNPGVSDMGVYPTKTAPTLTAAGWVFPGGSSTNCLVAAMALDQSKCYVIRVNTYDQNGGNGRAIHANTGEHPRIVPNNNIAGGGYANPALARMTWVDGGAGISNVLGVYTNMSVIVTIGKDIYVNGVLVGTDSAGNFTTDGLCIGSRRGGNALDGTISHVAVYNTLSPAQAVAITNALLALNVSPSIFAGNPVMDFGGAGKLTAWGSAIIVGNTWHHYYTYKVSAVEYIGHATSSDGYIWTADVANNPVLQKGAAGKFDDVQVWLPHVWIEGATYYMLYTGRDSNGYNAIGLATAAAPEGPWTRANSGDAILSGTAATWDANDVELSTIIKIGTTYYLWYNTLNAVKRETGLATADDLLGPWTKHASNPIFTSTLGIFCGDCISYGGYYYYFTPHYGNGTSNAYIELYRDTLPTFLVANRRYMGKIIPAGAGGTWNDTNQDTPWIMTDDITRSTFACVGNKIQMYFAGEDAASVWRTGLCTINLKMFENI